MSFTNHPITIIGVIVGCSVLGLVALVLLGLFLTSRGKKMPKPAEPEVETVAYPGQKDSGSDSLPEETLEDEEVKPKKKKKRPKRRDKEKNRDEKAGLKEKEQDNSVRSTIDETNFIYTMNTAQPKLGDDLAQLRDFHTLTKSKNAAGSSDAAQKKHRKPGEKKRTPSQPGLGSPSGTAEKEKSPEKKPEKSPSVVRKKSPEKRPEKAVSSSTLGKSTEKKRDRSPTSSAQSQSSSEDGKREKTEGKREVEDTESEKREKRKKREKHDETGTRSEEKSRKRRHHSGQGSRRPHSSHHHQGTRAAKPRETA